MIYDDTHRVIYCYIPKVRELKESASKARGRRVKDRIGDRVKLLIQIEHPKHLSRSNYSALISKLCYRKVKSAILDERSFSIPDFFFFRGGEERGIQNNLQWIISLFYEHSILSC